MFEACFINRGPGRPPFFAECTAFDFDDDLDVDLADLIAFQTAYTGPVGLVSSGPWLVNIMGGIQVEFGAPADTFISPLGEDTQLLRLPLLISEPVTLTQSTSTYTGSASPPSVSQFTSFTKGYHVLVLDPAPEPGHWLRLDLAVVGQETGLDSKLTVWVAHQPLDLNQDGVTDIRDVTVFGTGFKDRLPSVLADINGDGLVNVRDATTLGQLWDGTPPAKRARRNTSLPLKPQ